MEIKNEVISAVVTPKKSEKPAISNEQAANLAKAPVEAAVNAVVPPVTTEPAVVTTPVTISRLDRLMKGLTADHQALVASMPESHREKIAEALFKTDNPQGCLKEFQAAALTALQKLAEENLVSLSGMEVLARFPKGEGLVANTEFAVVGTYEAKGAKAEKGQKDGTEGKKGWGKVEVLANGAVLSYTSLGDASSATHENIKTQWAQNMVEAFRKAGYTDIKDITDGHAITAEDKPQGHGIRMTRPA